MKTMSARKASQSLDTVLLRVLKGEDIGIVHSASGKIVALRPVEEDYAFSEYGLNAEEMKRAEKKILKKLKGEKTKPWDGTAKGLRG